MEELEATVEIMRNLIMIQENESIIENELPHYINEIARLLVHT